MNRAHLTFPTEDRDFLMEAIMSETVPSYNPPSSRDYLPLIKDAKNSTDEVQNLTNYVKILASWSRKTGILNNSNEISPEAAKMIMDMSRGVMP